MTNYLKSLRNIINSRLQDILFPLLVKRIARKGEIRDPKQIYNYMARSNFGIISAIQRRDELVPTLSEIKMLKPSVVLEIGTANGETVLNSV